MSDERARAEEDLPAEEIIRMGIARRGDILPESRLFIETLPRAYAINQPVVGYVHQYEGMGMPGQVLTVQMRELIATCQLAAKGDDRFAANHVRRLWRLGVCNKAIFEAALAMIPATGFSTIPHVASAVIMAGDPDYKEGVIPEGGAPAISRPFAELSQGRSRADRSDDTGLLADPDWQDIAALDAEYARRAARLIDFALLLNGPGPQDLLGPGPRELICIAGLCGRGMADIAARHVRRARAWGMSRHQIFEAVSCITPMSGIAAVQTGIRAIRMGEA